MIDDSTDPAVAAPTQDPNGKVHIAYTAPGVVLDARVDHALVFVPREGGHLVYVYTEHPVDDLAKVYVMFRLLLDSHPAGKLALQYADQLMAERGASPRIDVTLPGML